MSNGNLRKKKKEDGSNRIGFKEVIIRRVVLDNRRLHSKELAEILEIDQAPPRGKIETYLNRLREEGLSIEIEKERGNDTHYTLVFRDGPHTDDDAIRDGLGIKEKHLVARLTASLICGFPEATAESTQYVPQWMKKLMEMDIVPSTQEQEENWWQAFEKKIKDLDEEQRKVERSMMVDKKEPVIAARVRAVLSQLHARLQTRHLVDDEKCVLDLLRGASLANKIKTDSVSFQLQNYWNERNRLVAIDSGTTNNRLARYLAQLSLPASGTCLGSLTVCTNSRKVFEILGPSYVSIRTIIIGGQQKNPSPTIAGALAELFLRTASILQFGMCILGATKLDLQRFACCSDSQEEASIKMLLMEKSSLRVIAVDNTKLQLGPGRTGYRFAAIDPRQIDLVITNSPLKTPLDKKKEIGTAEEFAKQVNLIESRGVPVLVAVSDETLPFVRTAAYDATDFA